MEAAAYCNENVTVMLMKADRIERGKQQRIRKEIHHHYGKKKNGNITNKKYFKNSNKRVNAPGGAKVQPSLVCFYLYKFTHWIGCSILPSR